MNTAIEFAIDLWANTYFRISLAVATLGFFPVYLLECVRECVAR